MPRVAIVGAGAIGLSIGWRLAQAGCAVDIFDRGAPGRGASWAAAGMLAAGIEAEAGEETLWPLARLSQQMWPGFARELETASGETIGYRDEGTLAVALTRDDAERLRFDYERQTRLGVALQWLSGAEALQREPYLNPRLAAACFSPADGQVDNRRLVGALAAALVRAGGAIHAETAVEAIDIAAGSVRGLVADGRRQEADIVVVAAGAWSRALPGLPEQARPPVRPVKGQMLALRMDRAAPLLRHVVWAPNAYLVPRLDGRLIVGATVEERGFDAALTAGGVFALLDGAWRALPAIEELPIDEMWVGHRPGSRDDAPILGACGVDGLVLATGHHRCGILLAPVTAAAISECVLTGSLPEVALPFAIDRFAPALERRHG